VNSYRFQQILRRTILLPVLGLLLLSGIFVWQISRLTVAMNAVDHSDQVATRIAKLLRFSVDQETGLRGYQATGDPSFLQPYFDSGAKISPEISALRDLLGQDPDQLARLERVEQSRQQWELFAQNVLQLKHAGGDANNVQLNLQGKSLMDDLRHRISEMNDAEITHRDARSTAARHFSRVITVGSLIGALIFGAILGLYTRVQLHAVSTAFDTSLQQSRQRSAELEESRQWLQTTLASIGDAVITCDAEGRVNFMNAVAEKLCGWTSEEAQQQQLDAVFQIENEYTREVVENPVTKVLRMKTVVGLANHTVLISRDGTEYNIDDSGAPICSPEGEIAGIVLIFRDITEQRKSQEAIFANEKLALAGRLAASIAHEIHNPLDSVANLLYLLARDPSPQEASNYLALARQELSRVTQISRTMLSLYREPRSPVPIDLRDALESSLLLLERKLKDLGVNVITDFQPAMAEGFPAELRQVFANLIGNAAEATGADGTIRISLRPLAADESPAWTIGGSLIEISDDGPGIPADIRSRLFTPFFTTKAEQGTGLGLWISNGLIEKHSGHMEFISDTSPENHGTTFKVFLPSRMVPIAPLLAPSLPKVPTVKS
jgi:PAS domain S-box-containing protein